ncbi:ABC transporter permease [Allobranchiibius sp. CTAmp26]|uniref:ABC transporter permease n=1 Tax=Allobranchiibius sp. CTAmp26 TaxID=2815214 RepID=UPI001AA11009|nr:ABC transporter permease [Allobranchiibius sp. CTAmp26]MBO1754906.1 FtsX-like permease family protein [Allobranchiibius sp. CTAmp26]
MARRPMGRVSIRNLRAHKVRLILTVLSVILGTAFVTGSYVFTDTLKSSFTGIFNDAYKGIATHVEPAHSYDAGIPFADLATIRRVPGVDRVAPGVERPAALVDSKGTKVASGGAPSVADTWTVPADRIGDPTRFESGGPPTRSGQAVLNAGAAHKGHIRVGDRVRIVLSNRPVLTLTVSGIYRTKTESGGYIGVLLSPGQARQVLSDGRHYTSVDASAKPGVSEQELTARIAKVAPSGLTVETGTKLRDDTNAQIQTALSFVNYLLLAFGFIALIVGTFIIYNTFSMIVAQRLRELALLRAVGASRKQVRRSVLLEALFTGVIGSVLGIVGGVGLAIGLRELLNAFNVGLPSGSLLLRPRTLIVALVLGVGVTLLSAYIPARRASSIAPVEAMREEFALPSSSSSTRRTILGLALLVLGVVLTVLGATSSSTSHGSALIGAGLLGVGGAALMLSPVLARIVIPPIGWVAGRPFGRPGTLAPANAVRNPRRTAATAFALTLGLLIVSGISVIGASAKGSVEHLFDNNVRADLVLTAGQQGTVPQPAIDAAAKQSGVGSMTQFHLAFGLLDGAEEAGSGIDGPLPAVLALPAVSGSIAPVGNNLVASESKARERGWKIGSMHTLTHPGVGSVRLKLVGIYQDSQLAGAWLVSGATYRALTPANERAAEVGLIRIAPGADLSQVQSRVEKATNPYYVVSVDTRTQFKGQIAAQVNTLLGLLYALLALAIVIAILGIINTLALSVVERRREIGMMRAVGMMRRQVRRTIYLESFLIAVFGALLGLALGIVYGVLFTKLLKDQGLDVLVIPWTQALAFLVVAGIVGVLAALWPGVRAARTPPLAAIVDA